MRLIRLIRPNSMTLLRLTRLNSMKFSKLTAFSAAILAASLLFAQAQLPSGVTRVTTVEGITEYRLTNGLDVLLFPDSSKPTVTVNVTYKVGSRHEGYGETGMAHLLEHMMFKGTSKRNQLMGELQGHGAQFNGTTSWDRTNYFETVSASDENLQWALEMEADRMVNSRVSRQDLDSEMTVVRNEFENGENSPPRILEERVMSTAYLWHAYGHSPIGSRSDIENVPIPRLQAFYHNYYQPDNAVLLIAGKFDGAKTLGWINDTFGKIPKPTRQLTTTYTEEPVQDGEREVMLRRVGDVQELMMAFHAPSGPHPDNATLDVLAEILGDQPSGRLYKALVDSKKATAVSAENYSLHDPGVDMFTASVRKDGDLADVEKTMLSIIDSIAKEPPSQDEVDRAKTRILKNVELELNNSGRVGLVLSEFVGMGDWRLFFLDRDRYQKVTPADVARVAKQYLVASNRTIGRFIPTAENPVRAEVPATPDVAAMLKDYKGNAAVEDGEAFDPSPANIEARTKRITLPGGLKLVLLPKKTRGGTIVASLTLHFGDEKSLANKGAAPQIAGGLLMRGTQQHNRQQLQDELDKLKARVNVNGSLNGANANIETVRANFTATLRLAAEILRQPSFPESEFEQVRQAAIARIESQRSEPQSIATVAMSRFIAPYPAGDPRYVPTVDENIDQLKKVTLADAKKFYTDFYGASNGELAVVGDFDAAEVEKLAGELFGSWKSPQPYAVVKRTWQKLNPVNQMFEAPDKANGYFLAISTLNVDQDDPDYPTMFLANEMIGGNPKSRLWVRIREKDGLSYGVQSVFDAGAQEKFGRFIGAAIANPQNVPKVEAAYKDEIAKVLGPGFAADEIAETKKAFLQEQAVQRSQDQQLARLLGREAELGRTMKREADLEAKISSLTPEQVNAAVKKWIDPSAISYFKSGDFKKAGVTQ
jgi:zinc protease